MRLTLVIPPELERRLAVEAKARGLKVPDLALETLEVSTPAPASDSTDRSLIDVASEMWHNVPQSEWSEVPVDFAQNHRTYRKSPRKKNG